MDQSGGEIAARDAKPSEDAAGADDKDHLSALPDETLVLILLRVDTAAAGRTSALSRRWRRVWTLLPELRFRFCPAPHLIATALAAHDAPVRDLFVGTRHSDPEPVADCLRVAARRLSGQLVVENRRNADDVGEGDAAFELPCFERATTVSLSLGLLGITMPPASIFARLTNLALISVWFHGQVELGDIVSTSRCPSLQKLKVRYTIGPVNLAIHSKSLLQVDLKNMLGLQQFTIDAPALEVLNLMNCFDSNQPVAEISAPQLESLFWEDAYDPSTVQFREIAQPQCLTLTSSRFYVYGPHDFWFNHSCLRLLESKQFQAIYKLHLSLFYPKYIGNFQYLMEDLKAFPHLEALAVILRNERHAFGASIFHVLKLCANLQKFALVLSSDNDLEAQSTCQSGCVCDEPTTWKTEELTLSRLHALLFIDMQGTDHEVAFVKRLFSWATAIKDVRISYTSITASKAKEVHEMVLSLAMPETCITLQATSDAPKDL